jgi:excisionase family DNA binding protein
MAEPPKITIDDLIARPGRVSELPDDQVADTLKQIAERSSALRALETQMIWHLATERNGSVASDGFPRLLDAKQIAEHLAVPETWVREQARLGNLPSIKLGHYVRFRLDDVKQYLHRPAPTHLILAMGDQEELDIIHRMHEKEEIWPRSNASTPQTVPAQIADVLTAWITVLWAHAVHENGFFSRLKRRLRNTSPRPS